MLGLIMPLAGLLGLEVEGLGNRVKGLAIAYGLILILSAIGLGFLIAAGYIALSGLWGPLTATLAMAGGFLAIALLIYVVLALRESQRKRIIAERRRSSDAGAFMTTAALTALPLLSRSSVFLKLGLPVAAIAAFALMRDKNPPNS